LFAEFFRDRTMEREKTLERLKRKRKGEMSLVFGADGDSGRLTVTTIVC